MATKKAKKETLAKPSSERGGGAFNQTEMEDESDLLNRSTYFTHRGKQFVRFPSGDVMPISNTRGEAFGGRGSVRFGGGLTNRGK